MKHVTVFMGLILLICSSAELVVGFATLDAGKLALGLVFFGVGCVATIGGVIAIKEF